MKNIELEMKRDHKDEGMGFIIIHNDIMQSCDGDIYELISI